MTAALPTTETPSRGVIIRSLLLGMTAWGLSVLLGIVALAAGALLAVVLAPPGKRVLALAWAVVGGFAMLALLAMPFITPVELSTTS